MYQPDVFMPQSDLFATSHSLDRFLGGRLILRQPVKGYRAAIDPVLLAACVAAAPGQSVLDLGCGVGTAALCLRARLPEVRVTGIEIQPELAALARLNGLDVIEGDGMDPAIHGGGFDHVITNPPYVAAGRGTAPPDPSKAAAHVETVDLATWIKAAGRLLAPKGQLAVILPAERLDQLLAAMAGRGLGGIRIVPFWPKAGRPASRVVVLARKGSKAPMALLPGLVLHQEDGAYAAEAKAILEKGEGLAILDR
jgi:tRNA1(Val) A37 N6-methylase TrmN6